MSSEIALTLPPLREDKLGYFRWGRIGERVLLTNDAGDWMLLAEPDFHRLLAGEVSEGDPLHSDLATRGFLRAGIDLLRNGRSRARRQREPHGSAPVPRGDILHHGRRRVHEVRRRRRLSQPEQRLRHLHALLPRPLSRILAQCHGVRVRRDLRRRRPRYQRHDFRPATLHLR